MTLAVHDQAINNMIDMLKDHVAKEQLMTYVGLYFKYGPVLNEKDICDFFGLTPRVMKYQVKQNQFPIRVVRRGHQLFAPTASLIGFLYQGTDND
ncbi:hypothetical protein [Bowmanella sp. JS7-9]|uniref:DNA-binding protein n=1 Tax=Pseudobowmanella zhangzhouensis TaxID=1537679 RepID=A0ABW1XME0_9ALTE|nr:hypothetical protein [Bowmanella sp. JS7-9]TBX21952.1 hypothetical protein TK45_10740 [Bowmanella sp. JS7-9]